MSVNLPLSISPEQWTEERNYQRVRIGKLIKGMRESLKLSQKELSDRCEILKGGEVTTIDQATISKIESGKWGASIDTIWAIVNTMGYEITFHEKTDETRRRDVDDINRSLMEEQIKKIRESGNEKLAGELEQMMKEYK